MSKIQGPKSVMWTGIQLRMIAINELALAAEDLPLTPGRTADFEPWTLNVGPGE